jgi:hypothetical protein
MNLKQKKIFFCKQTQIENSLNISVLLNNETIKLHTFPIPIDNNLIKIKLKAHLFVIIRKLFNFYLFF